MILLIPIGGIGNRFKISGYKKPKALIDICGVPILFHLLNNLNLQKIKLVCIPYNSEYKSYNFESLIVSKFPSITFKFFPLMKDTRGAAETIRIALDLLISEDIKYPFTYDQMREQLDKPILCVDADNFYTCDIINIWNGDNAVITVKDYNRDAIYSYVKVDNKNNILDIQEKVKISNNACSGAYGFSSYYDLYKYASVIIKNDKRQKGEYYTSGIIQEMIQNDYKFKNIEIPNKNYFSLGTPKAVEEYEQPFIFDLDGTLVITDHIYTKVWSNIMSKYNLSIDDNFFNYFIRGKNDISFLKYIFPNISHDEIMDISKKKDSLFIKYLNETSDNIFVNGAKSFIQNNKNRKIGIVTSCNRVSAEYIIKKCGLDDYINFLITADDCKNHKPHKEPYLKAIKLLETTVNKCTIFEDSNSGYKSAKSLGDINITLILHENSSYDILNADEYKIRDYNDFKYEHFKKSKREPDIKDVLINKLDNLPIVDIKINNIDMKTGYICDIKSLRLVLNDDYEDVVLKIENKDNELSNVARKINLYSNEVYFYEKLANIINLKSPKFYTSVDYRGKKSILLENLHKYNGSFNLDLNTNIDILLTVVKHITNMHNRFCFKNQDEILPDMKKINKINEITFYKTLIDERYEMFLKNNKLLLTQEEINIFNNIYNNFDSLINNCGNFPLNFCHGDLKSPNIFYKNNLEPYFLDWQYIHLNKGISDIVFLLVESTDYDQHINSIILNYYYKTSNMYDNYELFLLDFKTALCIFPFFVLVWFNSENRDNLLDKVFPINFMKNTLKFFNEYLDNTFFNQL